MIKELLPPEQLRQMLRYEPETGKLFWLPRTRSMFKKERFWLAWNTRFAGKEALYADNGSGYRGGSILNRTILAHRAAWCVHHGYWPDQVDHINLNKKDNRLVNLREANRSQNLFNTPAQSNNTSGVKGVYWHKPAGKWLAQIGFMRRKTYLGLFGNLEDASAAYEKASKILHGEFGRTS